MSGLTKNEFKSTEIFGELSIVDYQGIIGKLLCDIIESKTGSGITINSPCYIPYTVWTTLGNNYYNQYATGYGTYLNQYE